MIGFDHIRSDPIWAPPEPVEYDIFGEVFADIFGVTAMKKQKKQPVKKTTDKVKRPVTPRQKNARPGN